MRSQFVVFIALAQSVASPATTGMVIHRNQMVSVQRGHILNRPEFLNGATAYTSIMAQDPNEILRFEQPVTTASLRGDTYKFVSEEVGVYHQEERDSWIIGKRCHVSGTTAEPDGDRR